MVNITKNGTLLKDLLLIHNFPPVSNKKPNPNHRYIIDKYLSTHTKEAWRLNLPPSKFFENLHFYKRFTPYDYAVQPKARIDIYRMHWLRVNYPEIIIKKKNHNKKKVPTINTYFVIDSYVRLFRIDLSIN